MKFIHKLQENISCGLVEDVKEGQWPTILNYTYVNKLIYMHKCILVNQRL